MRMLLLIAMCASPFCLGQNSSLGHYEAGDGLMAQKNYQAAANEYREALNGDLQPSSIASMAHIRLAEIFDLTDKHARAVQEYALATGLVYTTLTRPIRSKRRRRTIPTRLCWPSSKGL